MCYNTLKHETYVQDVVRTFAEEQTINKIDALLPWHLIVQN
jgi:hypothetical protein